jgi:hypothetical protein
MEEPQTPAAQTITLCSTFLAYIKHFSRPVGGLQKKTGVSSSTNLKDFFVTLCEEGDGHALLTFLAIYFNYYEKTKTEEKKLASSALLGRFINISALVFPSAAPELNIFIGKVIHETPKTELEKKLKTLDKKHIPSAHARKALLEKYAPEIQKHLERQPPNPQQETLEILFSEAINAANHKNGKLEEAILAALIAYMIKDDFQSATAFGAAYVAYQKVGGKNKQLLEDLYPNAVQTKAESSAPQRSLSQDLTDIKTSALIASMKRYAKTRSLTTNSEFPAIGNFLTGLETKPLLQCLYLIVRKLLSPEFSKEKFESSAFIGRLINALSGFALRDDLLREYTDAKKLLNPDKSFDPTQRRKFLEQCKDCISVAMQHFEVPLPENSELESILTTVLNSNTGPKLRKNILDILQEKLNTPDAKIEAGEILMAAETKTVKEETVVTAASPIKDEAAQEEQRNATGVRALIASAKAKLTPKLSRRDSKQADPVVENTGSTPGPGMNNSNNDRK